MRRRTARAVTLALGILLTVCGLGYIGAQFIQGVEPDGVKIAFGVAMAAVGAVVIIASARAMRRMR
jgi:uncharacterized membrane protein YfcA